MTNAPRDPRTTPARRPGRCAEETRRLFHGRGRCYPGLEQLTVDWLQGVLLVALFRDPGAAELEALKRMLRALAESSAWQQRQVQHLLLQHRYLPDAPTEALFGDVPAEWQISENGLHYKLDLGRKQNNGLFLDMRYGPLGTGACARQARAQPVRLHLRFLGRGDRRRRRACGQPGHGQRGADPGRENHRLNGHELSRVSFLGHELFKSWGKVRKLGPYDLIIIDPPSFQKGSFALTRDYQKILRRLPELLNPGGQVLACVNDPDTGTDFLIQGMAAEAPQLRFSERLENPPEFPDISPESGLKALLFVARD